MAYTRRENGPGSENFNDNTVRLLCTSCFCPELGSLHSSLVTTCIEGFSHLSRPLLMGNAFRAGSRVPNKQTFVTSLRRRFPFQCSVAKHITPDIQISHNVIRSIFGAHCSTEIFTALGAQGPDSARRWRWHMHRLATRGAIIVSEISYFCERVKRCLSLLRCRRRCGVIEYVAPQGPLFSS